MATELNDMARIASESFNSLFGEREEDVQEAGFDPGESAWRDSDNDQDEEGDDD
jgi:hypothetical protein